jgi:predicted metal-binding transcription factor (methanogenesis marker protein 9)
MKKLQCKITKKQFGDIDNRSGIITDHLKKLNINIPSSFLRRQFLKKEGKSWHSQYFDIIEVGDKEIFCCKYCSWKTYDLENKSGCYTTHLLEEHGKNIEIYIEEFPEEKTKFKTYFNKKQNLEKTQKDGNYVVCKICNFKVRYLTNTHLAKHNISPEEYKIKFGINEYASKNFINTTRNILVEASKNITHSFVSKPEKDLKEYITNDLGINIIHNDKKFLKGVEIDILIPDLKIAIEFNGNLYHCENYGGKDKYFHLGKTEKCSEIGYKLIHIFEDEWFLKNDIVKSKIRHLFGLNTFKKRIHARKCEIKLISPSEKNVFLNKHHIQGEDKSLIHLGAFFDEKLMAVTTFDNKRKMSNHNNKKDIYELKRFVVDNDYNIPGIFSKILKKFIDLYAPGEIISFADKRWTINNENLYSKSGFKLIDTLKPDYTYYNSKVSRYKRFHKFSFGKKTLKKKFPDLYSDDKTEWQIMQEAGYDRIWDCGKLKYSMLLS